ncbi:MAG: sterol desaturase family protein [Cyclobacteriaceae bacterium]
MDINPVILSIPLYFTLIIIELIIQLFSKRKIYRTNDAITNISCGITSQIAGAFTKILAIGVYQFFYEHFALFHIQDSWWSMIILFLGVDFCYYWAHRASHEVNFLWNGGHVVHHQSEDYNFSVALRQSSLDIWTLWFYVPLALLGFDTLSFLFVKALNLIYQFWIHTEMVKKLPRPIEWIFNTPSHHRVHHGRNPKYIDKNHAGVFMFWDRVFGTFQEEEEKPVYGVTVPTQSWNPIWLNFQPYISMFRQVYHTGGFSNKVKVLAYKPGWRPAELGGYQKVSEVDKLRFSKFDLHPSPKLAYYVVFQFLILLGVTSAFLFQLNTLSLETKLIFSGFIVLSVGTLGVLLENKRQWLWLEFVRNLFFVLLIYFVTPTETITLIVAPLTFISVAHLIWVILTPDKQVIVND